MGLVLIAGCNNGAEILANFTFRSPRQPRAVDNPNMDTVFFIASKVVWAILAPASLLLMITATAWICLLIGWAQAGRRWLSVATLLWVLVGFLPLGEWLLAPLEQRFPVAPPLPESVAGVVVLGGAIDPYGSDLWGQPQLNQAAERIAGFLDLAARYPTATHVYTGGSGSLVRQSYKETDAADALFHQLGWVNHGFLLESASRNTVENAELTRAMVDPQPGETWILVTSAAHMPRAVGVFCAQQWPVQPWPVDFRTRRGDLWRVEFDPLSHLQVLDGAIREWVGLLAYRVTGRSVALLPRDPGCGLTVTGPTTAGS